MVAHALITTIAIAIAAPVLACAAYLAVLSCAAFRRRPEPMVLPQIRLAVVVPAHDEAGAIESCLESLFAQSYPKDLTRIVVVADNCTDSTAAIAVRAGVEVMIRNNATQLGKGHALRWAFDRLLDEPSPPDAIVVIDADSIADPGLLTGLAARGVRAPVVQGDYQVLQDTSRRSALRSAAFLLFHRSRFLGRAALGLGCGLVGNGMLLRRETLERVPWDATTSAEDLEYTITLALHGILPEFAPKARLLAPAPTGGRAGHVQRTRWEGGRFHSMRHGLPRLIGAARRRNGRAPLATAMDLAVPPLGLLVLLCAAGSLVTGLLAVIGVLSPWALTPWLGAMALIAVHVVLGLVAAGAPAAAWLALIGVPWFLLLKIATYARLSRGLRADRWERTPRDTSGADVAEGPGGGEHGTPAPAASDRVALFGVPIDVVDRNETVVRLMDAVRRRRFTQVCTVNLHFLTTARHRTDVREVLASSDLNIADGAPVVWLGRRFGAPLPGRVAGADVVPDLLDAAARDGHSVFLLGGHDGVADDAATALRARYPGLVVAGTFEPDHSPVDALPTAEILRRLHDEPPDILLVGLGHPKQELWIHRNREQLPVSVAIGVGCTLELIASRASRAPVWMQRHGLEWLYRIVRTPGRLAWRYAMCAITLFSVFVPAALLHSAGRGRRRSLQRAAERP